MTTKLKKGNKPGHFANLNIQCDPGVFKKVVTPHLCDLKKAKKLKLMMMFLWTVRSVLITLIRMAL